MLGEAVMGLSALKTALDVAKGLKGIDDAVRVNAAVIELQENILAAQEAQATLVKRVGELEAEVARLKAWDGEKQRYQLTNVGSGVLAYALKDGMENGEPPHQLCTSCFQAGFKSMLNKQTWNPGLASVLICNDCGWYAYLSGIAHSDHKNLRPKPYRGA